MPGAPGAGTVVRSALTIARWSYRRAFSATPALWTLLLVVALVAITVDVALFGAVAWPWTAVPLLGALVAVAALAAWAPTLGRRAPVKVFLCRFDEHSADTTTVADLQSRAVEERLLQDELLATHLDVRRIPVVLDADQAGRLLSHSKGNAALTGRVVVAGGSSRWSTWCQFGPRAMTAVEPTLWRNAAAAHPIGDQWPWRTVDIHTGGPSGRPTAASRTCADVLGLPPGWPHESKSH